MLCAKIMKSMISVEVSFCWNFYFVYFCLCIKSSVRLTGMTESRSSLFFRNILFLEHSALPKVIGSWSLLKKASFYGFYFLRTIIGILSRTVSYNWQGRNCTYRGFKIKENSTDKIYLLWHMQFLFNLSSILRTNENLRSPSLSNPEQLL